MGTIPKSTTPKGSALSRAEELQTRLIVMQVSFYGWWDNGSTTAHAMVNRHPYDIVKGKYEPHESECLLDKRKEVFMGPHSSDSLSSFLMKAHGAYTAALELP